MLRITLHQDGRQCRLELSGRLCGPWVAETENVWRSALSLGKEIEVDMREVRGIDGAGCELLATMHEAGTRFVAQGVAMTTLLGEITGKEASDGTKQQRPRQNVPKGRRFRIRRDSK